MDKKEERFKSNFESLFLATQGNISIASFKRVSYFSTFLVFLAI